MRFTGDNNELKWNNDGHILTLRLNKYDLESSCTCPKSPNRSCGEGDFCIVDYFITRFGLECNIGVCAPAETMEICWTLVGDIDDPDLAQVWFVPINDEVFYAWMVSRSTTTDSGGPVG